MNILITNDDGVHAKGIQRLYHYLTQSYECTIVAPENNMSATSSHMTLEKPLSLHQFDSQCFYINGTPVDCVYLASRIMKQRHFQCVVSGINLGANLGNDVLYSGTVAAALEGRHLPFPAIAISLASHQGLHFDTAAKVALDIIPLLPQLPLMPQSILNINVPDLPYDELKGIKYTHLGQRECLGSYHEIKTPKNKTVYWIGVLNDKEKGTEYSDFRAIHEGYVSITPLTANMTCLQSINNIKNTAVSKMPEIFHL